MEDTANEYLVIQWLSFVVAAKVITETENIYYKTKFTYLWTQRQD